MDCLFILVWCTANAIAEDCDVNDCIVRSMVKGHIIVCGSGIFQLSITLGEVNYGKSEYYRSLN